jgi:hypothetical protein
LNRKVKAPNTFYIQPEILTALKFATTTESTARLYFKKIFNSCEIIHANKPRMVKVVFLMFLCCELEPG